MFLFLLWYYREQFTKTKKSMTIIIVIPAELENIHLLLYDISNLKRSANLKCSDSPISIWKRQH